MRSVPSVGSRLGPSRRTWRTLGAAAVAMLFFAATLAVLSSGLGLVDAARWAATQQRAYYDMMQHLLEHRGGWASAGLIGACFVYGVVHAAVPGHGKFVIAAAGVGSRITTLRLVAIGLAASLTQALTAIVLVYGAFSLMSATAGWAMDASRYVLEPVSALVIVAIGLVLVNRSIRGFEAFAARTGGRWAAWRSGETAPVASHHHHEHDDACGCGHRHGPTVEEAERVAGWREALVLIASIGLRPCTGAVFVLAAAWRFDLVAPGAAGAVAMALGTGLVVALVAVSATSARGATLFAAGMKHAGVAVPILQLVAGAAVLLLGVAFFLAPFIGATIAAG